ncbi:MAG: DUF4038 domain-containing protein [Gammaproteobacteria bacterium]|nr:DUF4038 domain-containing protein [Gammaproteobacteria bacterium]
MSALRGVRRSSQHFSDDGRYLVDQTGKPFFINGDAPWSLITGLTKSEAELYLNDRHQRGFNAIIVNLIEP